MGIPSYDDYGKEEGGVDGGRRGTSRENIAGVGCEGELEGGGRGTSSGKNTLGGWLQLSRGVGRVRGRKPGQ